MLSVRRSLASSPKYVASACRLAATRGDVVNDAVKIGLVAIAVGRGLAVPEALLLVDEVLLLDLSGDDLMLEVEKRAAVSALG